MLFAAFSQYFFGITIFILSVFLILLVLVQRGRGGGLTGALGGPGGQSAFGTKAGDLFTRITIAVAAVWIFLVAGSVLALKSRALPTFGPNNTSSSLSGNIGEGSDADASSNSAQNPATDGVSGLGTMPGGELDLTPPATDDMGTQGEITEFPEGESNPAESPTEPSSTEESTTTEDSPSSEDTGENTEEPQPPSETGDDTSADDASK